MSTRKNITLKSTEINLSELTRMAVCLVQQGTKKMKATNLVRIMFAGAVLLILVQSTAIALDFYEAYYRYLGNYPDELGEAWTRECQGLAHDSGHWFISLNNAAGAGVLPHPQIWKVPVTQDLEELTGDTSGIPKVFIQNVQQLSGYDHCGDPDYYDYQGTGYLLIPVNNGGGKALAVFYGSNLSYVGKAGLEEDTHPSWCAVDRANPEFVYFPNVQSKVAKYRLVWADLPGALTLDFEEAIHIYDENSNPLNTSYDQGGEFTPSGELFYMVTGKPNPDDDDPHPDEEGIHVFDTQTWQRIKHSTRGSGAFNFDYDPYGISSEEPEGITIWDLDGAGAPGISGQVHVIVLDNDADDFDDVYIKHYTNRIHVNLNTPMPPGNGTFVFPFKTVGDASAIAWDGCEIRIHAGSYNEAVIFGKRSTIVPLGGTVIIGK